MATTLETTRASKRGLIVHDSLVFLALTGVSIALFLVTLFLFRSFENHREDLGKEWSERGRLALQQGRPAEAVAALRTALTYREGLPEQMLLAQALADAGHTEEATNYFLNLRESRPGDGMINLQLARLRRKQGDAEQAINFYRASIFGNWEGDGAIRRPEVRLELAGYLAGRGNTTAARDEILIAAGNTPNTPASDAEFADHLAAINDPADALTYYRKSLALDPHQPDTLAKAGRLAYAMADYNGAYKLLTEALAQDGHHPATTPADKELATLAADAHRLPELSLSRNLSATERADHIVLAARIAHTRLQTCAAAAAANTAVAATAATAAPSTGTPPTPALLILQSRWAALNNQLKERTLERDAALEDTVTQLIFDTETGTVASCGPPSGDDALLLKLASAPQATAE